MCSYLGGEELAFIEAGETALAVAVVIVLVFAVLQAAFDMRMRAYSVWQTAQLTLSKKREQEQKLTAAGKLEKLPAVKAEIEEVSECVCVYVMIVSCGEP